MDLARGHGSHHRLSFMNFTGQRRWQHSRTRRIHLMGFFVRMEKERWDMGWCEPGGVRLGTFGMEGVGWGWESLG